MQLGSRRRLQLLDLGHDRMEIVVWRRAKVETAHDGVNFLRARNFLRLSHRVYDAHLTARADHDQTTILQI